MNTSLRGQEGISTVSTAGTVRSYSFQSIICICHDFLTAVFTAILTFLRPRPQLRPTQDYLKAPMSKPGKFSRVAAWYDKIAAFNIETLFVKKRSPGPRRTVYVNESLPEDYYDKKGRIKKEHVFTSNQVITSKYNVFTFVPRNLLEQFRRVANVYVPFYLSFFEFAKRSSASSLGSLSYNFSPSSPPFPPVSLFFLFSSFSELPP